MRVEPTDLLKILGLSQSQKQLQEGEAPAAAEESDSGSAEVAGREETLTLTPEILEILEGNRAVKEQPDVRAERVDELKARLESGDYDVGDEELAQSILDKLMER